MYSAYAKSIFNLRVVWISLGRSVTTFTDYVFDAIENKIAIGVPYTDLQEVFDMMNMKVSSAFIHINVNNS